MAYASSQPQAIPTFAEALQNRTVDDLKKIAARLSDQKNRPIRKPDLINFILRHVNGESGRLRQVEDDPLQVYWRQLDTIQQAAVAETVHGPRSWFDAGRFAAKYGQSPDWGTSSRFGYEHTPSLLGVFFFDGVMPEDLRRRFRAFVPQPEAARLASQGEIPTEWVMTVREWDQTNFDHNTVQRSIPLTQRLTERAAIHDLKAVLRPIDAAKLAVSDKTQQPGATTLRTLAGLVLGGISMTIASTTNTTRSVRSSLSPGRCWRRPAGWPR